MHNLQKKKDKKKRAVEGVLQLSTSWMAVSWRSGRLLFTASLLRLGSRDLTACGAPRVPLSRPLGHCHCRDWGRCRCGAQLREVGHAPAGCVQSKQGLIMHKVSCAPFAFFLFSMCEWKEVGVSVNI